MFALLTENLYVVYSIGLLAFVVMVISFQFNVRTRILYSQVLGMTLLGIHLWLLGALTGAAMMLVMIVRNLLFAQKERFAWASHQAVLLVFLSLLFAAGIWSWTGIESLSAIVGSWLATYGFWITEPKRIRLVILLSALGWAPYGIVSASYPMLLLQIFIVVSIIVAIWRYDWKPAERSESKV